MNCSDDWNNFSVEKKRMIKIDEKTYKDMVYKNKSTTARSLGFSINRPFHNLKQNWLIRKVHYKLHVYDRLTPFCQKDSTTQFICLFFPVNHFPFHYSLTLNSQSFQVFNHNFFLTTLRKYWKNAFIFSFCINFEKNVTSLLLHLEQIQLKVCNH